MGIKVQGIKEVIRALKGIDNKLNKKELVKELTEEGYKIAKGYVSKHTKTGRMERNLTKRVRGNTGEIFFLNQGMVKSGTNYAVFVHYGTRPHVILPKNKKALRWKGGGQFHFAKKVNHPGYAGDPFFDKTREKLGLRVPTVFDKFLKGLGL